MFCFERLIFDISYRDPRKVIIFRATEGYFVGKIKLSENFVSRLIDEEFVKINKFGGMIIQEKCLDFAQDFLKSLGTVKVESHRQKGQFMERAIFPEEFNGEE